MILTVSADNIYHHNPTVAKVLGSVFASSNLGRVNVSCDLINISLDDRARELEDKTKATYGIPLRESIKMFRVVEWMLHKHDLKVFGISKLMEYFDMMPIIAYEMLPVFSKVIYSYLLKSSSQTFDINK